jgi:hypothetical protein
MFGLEILRTAGCFEDEAVCEDAGAAGPGFTAAILSLEGFLRTTSSP